VIRVFNLQEFPVYGKIFKKVSLLNEAYKLPLDDQKIKKGAEIKLDHHHQHNQRMLY
jgi:hypothetical protein